jgi:hemerythrin-like metal-binding protein
MEAHLTTLTWNHAGHVGVRAMDDQHGIIMETMNELHLALAKGSDSEQVSELLDLLFRFTRLHFWSEERLLEEAAYPGLAGHRAEHQRLMGHIRDSVQRAQYSKNAQMRELLDYMSDWLAEHFEVVDRQYGPWLNDRGVD